MTRCQSGNRTLSSFQIYNKLSRPFLGWILESVNNHFFPARAGNLADSNSADGISSSTGISTPLWIIAIGCLKPRHRSEVASSEEVAWKTAALVRFLGS